MLSSLLPLRCSRDRTYKRSVFCLLVSPRDFSSDQQLVVPEELEMFGDENRPIGPFQNEPLERQGGRLERDQTVLIIERVIY